MTLENSPLLKGQSVYGLVDGKWKSGLVQDLNEHMRAAKLQIVTDTVKSKYKSLWLPESKLTRNPL